MDGPRGRGYKASVKQTFGCRPPRLSRIFDQRPLYFVTFCTYKRKRWLAKDEILSAFVSFAQRAEHDFNVAVGRYVLMPEHIHLFVRGELDFVLGQWVGRLKQALAKAGGLSSTRGQIWQEGSFDHILRSDESYAQKWEYVRQNPVRAGLIDRADDWPYQGPRRDRLHRSRIGGVAMPCTRCSHGPVGRLGTCPLTRKRIDGPQARGYRAVASNISRIRPAIFRNSCPTADCRSSPTIGIPRSPA